jgi:hypothetical protein
VLGHFVHVTEACEAVAPRDFTRLVEDESALLAASVFELPGAYRATVDAVFLVSEDLEGWPASLEGMCPKAALEEAASARVCIVLVRLHGIGLFLLPLLVFVKRLAWGKQFEANDEDAGHVPNLRGVLGLLEHRVMFATYYVGRGGQLLHDDAAVGARLAVLVVGEPRAEALHCVSCLPPGCIQAQSGAHRVAVCVAA